jgi:hypothetical protein
MSLPHKSEPASNPSAMRVQNQLALSIRLLGLIQVPG